MSRELSYTTRTFYVPAEKIETLVQFQGKCKENGHKSYSEVILKLMEDYNDGSIRVLLQTKTRVGLLAS